jgi:hypothetical protein
MSTKLRLEEIRTLVADLRAMVESGKEIGVFDVMQYAEDATSALEDLLAMVDKQNVWIATIKHKHGTNMYVGSDKETCTALVLEYVQEYWDSFCTDGHPIPENPHKAIELYFEAAVEHEYLVIGAYQVVTKQLPEFTPDQPLPAIFPCPACKELTSVLNGLRVVCWCGTSGPHGSTEHEAIVLWNQLPR